MPTPSASDRLSAATPAVARFAADLAALDVAPTRFAPLALAVSGGPDSMAMLALALAAFPGAVAAATVDHRLRSDSAAEAAMVADWCADAGIPHALLTVAEPLPPGENLHAWARAVRYRLLHEWRERIAAPVLATAHHADDQAETFLMRAGRGAGLSGLAGVRSRVGDVIRPLLGWRRAELRAVATAGGIPFVDDPGNADPRFDRARFRSWLAAPDAPDAAQVARAAGRIGAIDADLRTFADVLWTERSRPTDEGAARIDVAGLPRTLRRYLVALALARIGGAPAERHFEPLLDALEAGTAATHGPVMGSAKGTIWTFHPAPPRRTG